VAAAVVLPRFCVIRGADDSKKLKPTTRVRLDAVIRLRAAAVGVGAASARFIDRHNIRRATFHAMRLAVARLCTRFDLVLCDGEPIPGLGTECRGVIRGDCRSLSIACASIVAKVFRDRLMQRLDPRFPGYGLARNAGYGTSSHIEAVSTLGPSPVHRRTFAPMRFALGSGT
jgi:ribonuclease HII